MQDVMEAFRKLRDEALLVEVRQAVARERTATSVVVAGIAELSARRLYVSLGYHSLTEFCMEDLKLSRKEAQSRVRAAHTIQTFPAARDFLGDGTVTLTNLYLLAPHLTEENHLAMLRAAQFRTKREVQEQVAALYPDRPRRVIWRHAVPEELDKKLQLAQELLRHQIPDGDPVKVLDLALSELIERREKQKLGLVRRPQRPRKITPGSRHVPVSIRRQVWDRDGGRCTFVGTEGRCRAIGYLEFHHIVARAYGGPTTVDNIQLRCRTHNQYEADRDFPKEPEGSAGGPGAGSASRGRRAARRTRGKPP
jgi:5-methylcytosine-specific restriction endonuclease McrA